MVLNDISLREWAADGGIRPFVSAHINPASVDLTLGPKFKDMNMDLDCDMHRTGVLTIQPGRAILASTNEYVTMPKDCAGVLYLKSSLARQGLDHALAGWIDPGFNGEITLELHSHRPLTLNLNQRICQLVLYRMIAPPERDYTQTGRYNGQRGPTEAK